NKTINDMAEIDIRRRELLKRIHYTNTIKSNEITTGLEDEVEKIVNAIKVTLEKTPPELSADIMDRGIVLSGGGALLKNLSAVISDETEIPVFVAENPLDCVAIGTGKSLEN